MAFPLLSEREFLDRTGGNAPFYFAPHDPRATPQVRYFSDAIRNFLRPMHIEHEKVLLIVENHRTVDRLCAEQLREGGRLEELLPLIKDNGALLKFTSAAGGALRVKPGQGIAFLSVVQKAIEAEACNSPEVTAIIHLGVAGSQCAAHIGFPQDIMFGVQQNLGTSPPGRSAVVNRALALMRGNVAAGDEAGPSTPKDDDDGDKEESPAAECGELGTPPSSATSASFSVDIHAKALFRGSMSGGSVRDRVSHCQSARLTAVQRALESSSDVEPEPSAIEISSLVDIHRKMAAFDAVWIAAQSFPTFPPTGPTRPAYLEHERLSRIARLCECASLQRIHIDKLLATRSMRLLQLIADLKEEYGVFRNLAAQKELDRRNGRIRQQSGTDMENAVWATAIPHVIDECLARDPQMLRLALTMTSGDAFPTLGSASAAATRGGAYRHATATAADTFAPLREWFERCRVMELSASELAAVRQLPNYTDAIEACQRRAAEAASPFRAVNAADLEDAARFARFFLFSKFIARRPFLVFVTENVAVRVRRLRVDRTTPGGFLEGIKEEGELDGLLVDAVAGHVLKIVEIKRNPADLTHAMRQRDRFATLLHNAITVEVADQQRLINARLHSEQMAASIASGGAIPSPPPLPAAPALASDQLRGISFALKPTGTTPAHMFALFPLNGAAALFENFGTKESAEANWIVVTQRRDADELPMPAKAKHIIALNAADGYARFLLSHEATTGSAIPVSTPPPVVPLISDEDANHVRSYVSAVMRKSESYTPLQLYKNLLERGLLHNVVWIELSAGRGSSDVAPTE